MKLAQVKLTDRYDLDKAHVLLSGTQALVRLTLMQHERDKAAGLDTAGYVSGYRGSPLGGLDQQFARAKAYTDRYGVVFQPGLNEDVAATALWGTQQAEMRGEGKHDGVYGIWYGKGPGVDRSGDVFRHANMAGTSKHGGVLVLMGDDHMAESSTVAHQSEFALMDVMMPVLNPAGVQEVLDFGVLGWALSRYSGCWVGIKCVKDIIESTAIVDASVGRVTVKLPDDFQMPEGGLNIRPSDDRIEQEARMHDYKRHAAVAFAQANDLNRIVYGGGRSPKIGIVSTGKSYLDVREALDELSIDEVTASRLGIRLLKIGMPWPLDPQVVARFAKGLDLVIVVEEKRSLIETQLREQLYGTARPPVVIGKKDEDGRALFPAKGTLDPNRIAIALATRLIERDRASDQIKDALERLGRAEGAVRNTPDVAARIPYFCAGCPHNSSTVIPKGARGYAGIGCHWMVQYIPERNTEGATHMGGEGANWIGEAPFSTRRHVFQNLGDGTYNHSGILSLRGCVAAGVNVTYKILYNDAVAMTGGQAHEGGLSVPMIASQVIAEGAKRVVVVSDEPDKYAPNAGFPQYTSFHHRDDIDAVQTELQEIDGVTVLIYDQTCAAEKRRRRKRGKFPDPNRRVFINDLVCEGCGDCGVQSNCVAVVPEETEFGRKRRIDQSACNKDFSCLKGFCPSFVTVEGGALARGQAMQHTGGLPAAEFGDLPEPAQPGLERPYGILLTGIGGTGVVTLGQIIGMAAHLEGKGAGLIDMAGLSQKNGSVVTHLKVAASAEAIQTIRLAAGGADLVLGCDLVTTAGEKNLSLIAPGQTRVVVNDHEQMTAQFTRDADFSLPSERLKLAIEARARRKNVDLVAANRLATALLGDSIGANLFLVGYASQKGLLPVSPAAIEAAIDLNGVSVEMNRKAYLWGRRAAHDADAVEALVAGDDAPAANAGAPQSLEELVERRVAFLTDYQNAAYGRKYRTFVDAIAAAEAAKAPGTGGLAEAVARNYFKLLAYKDEYEVARLYTDRRFARAVAKQFTGNYTLKYHLAPPILGRRDENTGLPKKTEFGAWMKSVFALLAPLKVLRGTALDPFGYSAERRMERQLIVDYEKTIGSVLDRLRGDTHAVAVEIASVPETIRGYGHVKARHIEAAKAAERVLVDRLSGGGKAARRAAA